MNSPRTSNIPVTNVVRPDFLHRPASDTEGEGDQDAPTWCLVSRNRLLKNAATFKPYGVQKDANLLYLVYMLNNISEDEEDVEFQKYLSDEDYEIYLKRQGKKQSDIMVFKPRYKIRPTAEQIMEKLGEYYNIELLNVINIIPVAKNKPKPYKY